MNDNLVMLFHTRTAADEFCKELKERGISGDTFTLIEANDLPQYGRGEHAVGAGERVEGFLDKLGKLFGTAELDPSRYHSLADFLEDRGLDRVEADYYENEVWSGSTMLCVLPGDRYDEIKELADRGVVSRGERGGSGIFNEGVSGRRVMSSDTPFSGGAETSRDIEGYNVLYDEEVIITEPDTSIRGDVGLPLRDQGETVFDRQNYPIGGVGRAENPPITGQPVGHEEAMIIDRDVDIGYRSDVSELGRTPPQQEELLPSGDLPKGSDIPPGAESRPVKPDKELDEIKRQELDEDEAEHRERPAA